MGGKSLYRINDSWCQYIPALHRAIADPSLEDRLPYVAEIISLEYACAAWETLHYLFTTLLGWESPGHGLAWWHSAGKPTDDPLLKLAWHYWDGHYQLDYYAAWAWTHGQVFMEPDELSPNALAESSLYPNEEWWHYFKRRGRMLDHDPFYGGTNPLHLGHSDNFGMDHVSEEDPEPVLHANTKDRKAVLIVSSIGHWRRNLINMGRQLPKLGENSWHVEVFDRQVGYLGLFRQSRVTGKWFMGKHSVHVVGNP